ncbi:MAG: ABC transporter substrate-binding protein [Rhodospirillales bacterium]
MKTSSSKFRSARGSRPAIHRRTFIVGLAGAGVAASFAQRVAAQTNTALELNVVQAWEIKSLAPIESGFVFNRAGVTETLAVTEPDGTVVPHLATRWSASEDMRIWRFELREGARFHDGTPVDAQAAAASLRRLIPRSQYAANAGIVAVEADGRTLVVKTAAPFSLLPAYLGDRTAPILGPASFDARGDIVRMVATGPFKIETMDLPRSVQMSRNDAYWGAKPLAARVTYQAVPNGETRSNIAIAGDADIVFNIPNPSVTRVAAAGRMQVNRVIIPRTHMLMPNVAQPQFADARVRRALSAAIDRSAIAATIMRNPALAATYYVPPTLKSWQQPDVAPLVHDVAFANRLLDETGWQRGADGIRAKDGKRFAGTVKTFSNRPELPVIATALQAQFRQVGFDLAVKVGDWTEIYEAQKDGSLELGLSSRNTVTISDPVVTIAADFTKDQPAAGGAGQTNWKNQAIRDAVAAYTQTTDQQRLGALRKQIVTILQDELPVIPVCWYDQIVAVRSDVAGFVNDPFDQRDFLERIHRKG